MLLQRAFLLAPDVTADGISWNKASDKLQVATWTRNAVAEAGAQRDAAPGRGHSSERWLWWL
jgi:hypothetical protein